MITIIWKCDKCGKEKQTKARLDDGWHIDNDSGSGGDTPRGWGSFRTLHKLLCPVCKNNEEKVWRRKHPDDVLMA